MPDYRLYFFDDEGHIRHVVALDCVDDAEAVRLVPEHADGSAMELWELSRLVRQFPREDG
jgi:hypothetical protein